MSCRFSKKEKETRVPVLRAEHCYAKSDFAGLGTVLLKDHCRLAGKVAAELIKNSSYDFPAQSPFLAASHDVGKASPGFLKKYFNESLKTLCPELARASLIGRGWEANHAVIGEAAFRHHYPNIAEWAKVVGVHHGLRKNPRSGTCNIYGGMDWAAERDRLFEWLEEQFGVPPSEQPTTEQFKLVAGLTCVSDWLASNEELFAEPATADETKISAVLEEAGWRKPEIRNGLSFEDVFPFSPNSMQQEFIQCVDRRGVYVLEAPMGLGKTEAALFAAYKLMESGQNSGLYFGLPTCLTSNRIHSRVEAFMDQILHNAAYVKLLHGQAWMNLESGAKEFRAGMSWFSPRKRAMLAPFGVGTVDQALLSILNVKHAFVRTFGLAGKVVILDEVHSYDAYTGTLLNLLIDELLKIGCSVIILSATLTAQRRNEFTGQTSAPSNYPLISSARTCVAPVPPEDHAVQIRFAEKEDLIDRAVEAASPGTCVLWIANSVAEAQTIYDRIQSAMNEGAFRTGLLHSRFPAWRRAKLEDIWMERLGKNGLRDVGCILVATQVVEQSVDIDADLLITELAPTDMLLQRIGRLWRHPRESRPCARAETWMYDAEEVSRKYIYSAYVLWCTEQVWRNRKQIVLPRDIRDLLEATYADRKDLAEEVDALRVEQESKCKKLMQKAKGVTALYAGDDDEMNAPTRYSTMPTMHVLIVRNIDDLDTSAEMELTNGETLRLTTGVRDFKAAVAVHQNLISMPRFVKEIKTTRWLESLVLDAVLVLKLDGEQLSMLDGTEVPRGYHPDKGVYKREGLLMKQQWEMDDESDW